MLEAGITLEQRRPVRRDDCITFLGGDVRPSLATPSMIKWMEICCRDAVLPHLETGQNTVGTVVNVKHLAASPMGNEVTYTSKLTEIKKRRLTFVVEAFDGEECIGEGKHERFIIDIKRFAERLKEKFSD